MALLILYWRFFVSNSPLIGFASIATVIFFLGAVQLVGIGFLGEYVGRIYEEVKGRPLYTLKETNGFRNQNASETINGEPIVDRRNLDTSLIPSTPSQIGD